MATEQELWRLIGDVKDQLRETIARAEAAERELAAAQERLRVMEWRPIAEYDDQDESMIDVVFGEREDHSRWTWDHQRKSYHTHFLQLPPIPEGE